MKYPKVDLHKKKAQALIIHCSDPRFQSAYRHLLDSFGHYYDLVVMPGASYAVVNNPSVIKAIKLLHGLHHFEIVHIIDHIECGVFGKIRNERMAHLDMCNKASKKIKAALPELKVESHLAGQDRKLDL